MPQNKNSTSPLLWIIAGPNGSGKSTYYESYIAQIINAPFINADNVALELFKRHPKSDSEMRKATKEAEKRRSSSLKQKTSFVMETVFSHPSKLELIQEAKAHGFQIRLTVICTQNPKLNVARVEDRVNEGGHPVPVDKITARYERSLPLLAQACREAHWATVRDNTSATEPFKHILTFEEGVITERIKPLPPWAKIFTKASSDKEK